LAGDCRHDDGQDGAECKNKRAALNEYLGFGRQIPGYLPLDTGCLILDARYWKSDQSASSIKYPVSRIKI
jgi:hypothetical protein